MAITNIEKKKDSLFNFEGTSLRLEADLLHYPSFDAFPDVQFRFESREGIPMAKSLGYRFPTAEELGALGLEPTSPEGHFVVNGELWLMICPKEHFLARQEAAAKESRDLVGNLEHKIRAEVAASGDSDGKIDMNQELVELHNKEK